MRSYLAFLSVCLVAFASCKVPTDSPSTFTPDQPGIQIEIGAEQVLTSTSVPPSGGTVSVSTGSNAFGGMTIGVPDSSYSNNRTFQISYAPITKVTGDSNVQVRGPVMIIENGGDYSNKPMIVKVPVQIAKDEFAMVIAVEEDGSIEGLPLLDEDANSITFWSMHFDYSDVHGATAGMDPGKHQIQSSGRHRSVLAIITMKTAKAMALKYSTGFLPGVDDWKFANRGSTVAPVGHCGGQSLGMIYYYIDRKTRHGDPQLNGAFDDDQPFATPNLVTDDRSPYRYCSVLHQLFPIYFNGHPLIDQALAKLGKDQDFRDSLTFMVFKLSMYLTHKPQLVAIWTGDHSQGHAMVVYGGDANQLFICDPNFPGVVGRTIPFDNFLGLGPYNSGRDADHLGTSFTVIQYIANSAALNWAFARNQYPKLLDHSIGAGYFPGYTITVIDSPGKTPTPMYQDWRTRTGYAQFGITSTATLQVLRFYAQDGTIIKDSSGWYKIPDDQNYLGIYVVDAAKHWAGFNWFEFGGKGGHFPARCAEDMTWQTDMTNLVVIHVDSGVNGRRIILEDESEPNNICTDVHPSIHWEATGTTGMKVEGYAYWGGLWGQDEPMTGSGTLTADDQIGLKQAYDNNPGGIGLQFRITFPSKGDEATDLNYFFSSGFSGKIVMQYKKDPG